MVIGLVMLVIEIQFVAAFCPSVVSRYVQAPRSKPLFLCWHLNFSGLLLPGLSKGTCCSFSYSSTMSGISILQFNSVRPSSVPSVPHIPPITDIYCTSALGARFLGTSVTYLPFWITVDNKANVANIMTKALPLPLLQPLRSLLQQFILCYGQLLCCAHML